MRHKPALISLVVLVLIALFVFFPTLLTDQDPLRASDTTRAEPPSAAHWMGTNTLGIDEMSRILHGGQVSLKVGIAVALVSGVIGVLIGALAAYYGRWLDNLLMRVTDLFLAVPLLVVVIIMSQLPKQQAWAETLLGEPGSLRSVITILSLFFWMPMARIVRGQILSLKEKEFIEAARAIGARHRRVLLRHLVPNCTGPIVVTLTLSVASAILLEASLSFLGYGINTTAVPTWGYLISIASSTTSTPGSCSFPVWPSFSWCCASTTSVTASRRSRPEAAQGRIVDEPAPMSEVMLDPVDPVAANDGPVLEVQDLNVTFATEEGDVLAVRGVDLHVNDNEVLGIVGESGSGKSVTMLAVMGLLPPSATITGSRACMAASCSAPRASRLVRSAAGRSPWCFKTR